jgi:hypothetical protein
MSKTKRHPKTELKTTEKNLVPVQRSSHTTDKLGNPTKDARTQDSFANFVAKLGLQADNIASYGRYELGSFITRDRLQLEAAYRGSWLIGRIVDCVSEDMTKAGVEFLSQMKPEDIKKIQSSISNFGVWHDLANAIKWSRLYGGAIAVMLIDGADYSKPLNIETIGKGKFKGLVVLDRWQIQPTVSELITDLCKDMGKPEYYEVLSGMSTLPGMKIHYTRVLRFEGIEMPYYQKLFENLWGISVVERVLDRLIAFDSSTQGVAQLMYRAHLRVIGVDGFREALATGGAEEDAVLKQFQYIRQMQNNEGITVLDGKDSFNVHSYSFGGISDILQQFAQQIAGAAETPLIRLFGQSPSGFSTGDTDLRNYYDHINKEQEVRLRPQIDKLFGVIAKSETGQALPDDFEYQFVSLWQLSETEKSQIASTDSNTIMAASDSGTIRKSTALKELLQSSRVTGRFSNITDEDIKDAEDEIPPGMPGAEPEEIKEAEDPNDIMGGQNPDLQGEKAEEESLENPQGIAQDGRYTKDSLFDKIKRWKDKYATGR